MAWLLAIVAVALALRLWQLDARPLWLDEVTTVAVASGSVGEIVTGQGFDRHTPPLHYLVMHPWLAVTPTTEWWLRLPSVLIDLIVVLLLVRLVGAELGRRTGLVAGAIWALSPFAIRFAQEARMYPLLVAWLLGAALASRALLLGPRPWCAAAALAACATGAAYTHYYALVVLAALPLAWWPELRAARRRRWVWFAAAATAAVAFLPWFGVVLRLAQGPGQVFRRLGLLALPHAVLRFAVGYGVLPLDLAAKTTPLATAADSAWIVVTAVGALLAVLAMGVANGRRGAPAAMRRLATLAVVPAVLAALVDLVVPSLSERYLVVVFPFVVGIAAAAPWGRRRQLPWWVLQGIAVAVLLVGLAAHMARPAAGTPRWREAAAVAARLPTAPAVMPGCYAPVLRYHLGRAAIAVPGAGGDDPRSVAAMVRRCRRLTAPWYLVEVARWPGLRTALESRGCPVAGERLLAGGNGLRLLRIGPADESARLTAVRGEGVEVP